MTNNRTLSSISIAAIALMAAAAPSFAQTGSSEVIAKATMPGNDLAISSIRIPSPVVNVTPVEADQAKANVTATKRGESLSAAMLKAVAAGQASISSQQLTRPDTLYSDIKTQFKAGSDANFDGRAKEFEFVPSRGQKSPE